jgi:hypothetical protein
VRLPIQMGHNGQEGNRHRAPDQLWPAVLTHKLIAGWWIERSQEPRRKRLGVGRRDLQLAAVRLNPQWGQCQRGISGVFSLLIGGKQKTPL